VYKRQAYAAANAAVWDRVAVLLGESVRAEAST
jgi:hypothetical protein